MTVIKRAWALALSVLMITSLIIASGVTTASAVAGAGLQQTSFRSYGADISFWNVDSANGNDYSLVDFAKMKADGCDFVILRLGYEKSATRQNTIDSAFVEYYKRARAAGMPLGVYFYQLGTTYESAVEDAQWVIKVIEENNMYFEYPIYYDVEDMGDLGDNPVGLGSAAMEQLCLGWCETLAAAGYFPGIYGGGWSVLDKLSADFKSKYDLWYAAYPSAQNPHLTTDKSGYCGMWQYAASGYNYDGVPASASLDVNVCYKDYPAIMKQYGYNNCGDSAAKTALKEALEAAKTLRPYPYNDAAISAIRTAYANAESVLANSASTDASCTSAKTALDNAIKNASGILSAGKSYTVSANPRTDTWKDDGVRLTDGVKGSLAGDSEAYAGLGTGNVDVVVDLGAGNGIHNNYGVYAAVNSGWGITAPKKVTVYVSNDNVNYSEVATSTTAYAIAQNDAWTTYFIGAHTEKYSFAERYVKFSIEDDRYIWLDEVTVSNAAATVGDVVYINGINETIGAGDCHVFTPAFGEVSSASANITWTKNVIVKWDSASSVYIVKEILGSAGSSDLSVTLQSDELLIAAHSWEGEGVEGAIAGSSANLNLLASLAVGDSVSLSGVDVANAKIAPASYVWVPAKETVTPEPTPERGENLATGKTYTASEIYGAPDAPLYPDEGGVTLTDGVVAALQCQYYDPAFVGFNANSEDYKANGYSSITVDLGDKYWVNKFSINVATSLNATAGIYAPGSIAVYVSEDGNEWTAAGSATPEDNSSVGIIDTAITLDNSVSARYVQFRIVAAEGKSWMFVSEVEVFEGAAGTEPEPDYLLGDVNNDGQIDSADYLIVKRGCFNSYTLSADESKRADVDNSASVDSADYVLVKRIAFGTY